MNVESIIIKNKNSLNVQGNYDLGFLFFLVLLIFRCEELRLHIELIIKDHQKSANVTNLVWQFSQNIHS